MVVDNCDHLDLIWLKWHKSNSKWIWQKEFNNSTLEYLQEKCRAAMLPDGSPWTVVQAVQCTNLQAAV